MSLCTWIDVGNEASVLGPIWKAALSANTNRRAGALGMPRVAWVIVFGALLSGCGKATDPREKLAYFEPAPLPCGIADEEGTTGFFVNPKGGLDAIQLESGKLLWQTATAFEPLITHSGRLFVLERTGPKTARIVGLNATDKGQEVWTSAPINLPPGRLREEKHAQEIRALRARIEPGQHQVWLALDFRTAARIDLDSGKVEMLPDEATGFWAMDTQNFAFIAKLAGNPDARGPGGRLVRKPDKALQDPQRRGLWYDVDKLQNRYTSHQRWIVGDTLGLLLTKR